MDDVSGWSIDADLSFAPLHELGRECAWVPWRRPDVDWDAWDVVYIAATWDYPQDPGAFLRVMESIDRSAAILVNDIELVRWNVPKTYLRDLESRGAAIVPSHCFDRFGDCDIAAEFSALTSSKIIVKPVISTNANNTFLLNAPIDAGILKTLEDVFSHRAFIVQPFIDAIQSDGEYSLFYIGGSYSHAIRKVPKASDFRVQEEHGADIQSAAPDTKLLQLADSVIALVKPCPLYARCDFVRDAANNYLLMELELIEPSLYLRMDSKAPERFARALDQYVQARKGVAS